MRRKRRIVKPRFHRAIVRALLITVANSCSSSNNRNSDDGDEDDDDYDFGAAAAVSRRCATIDFLRNGSLQINDLKTPFSSFRQSLDILSRCAPNVPTL
jgi:hypothetical protein